MQTLAYILVVQVLAMPQVPPIQVESFASHNACAQAAAKLDASTPVLLRLSCDVRI